jgi:bifunctional DNA-binding transcriptional regulator/antitoxin component of YhaV-PrlF toxin-antitoxin module
MFHTKPKVSVGREGLIHEGGSADRDEMGKRFILTTNKRGQLTFPKEVMEHCGLPSGGKLKVEFLPDRTCKFSPIHPRSRSELSQSAPSLPPESTSPAAAEAQ